MFQWQHLVPRVRGTTYFSILQCDSYLSVVFVLFLTWVQTKIDNMAFFFLRFTEGFNGRKKKKRVLFSHA